jgi:phytoene dehydrogenase-like protein
MHNVVVIGGGHNGLVAACYLARAGFPVVVLEAFATVGGMTQSAPLIAAAPDHLISPCAIDAVYWRASTVEQDLQLGSFGLKFIEHDPAWAWLGDSGESLLLRRDVGRTVAEVSRFSAADGRAYAEFVDVGAWCLRIQDSYASGSPTRPSWSAIAAMAGGLASRKTRRLLGALLSTSAAEVIEDLFSSVQMRGAFASMASILGSITADGSGLAALATAPLHRYGVGRPLGGMQAIPDALVRCLEHAGGKVRTEAPVGRIVVHDGCVTGVELADGERLIADCVVSAVAPQITGALLADSGVAGVSHLTRAPANAGGLGCFKVDLALAGRVAPVEHQRLRGDGVDLRQPTLFSGTLDCVLAAEESARGGRIPEDLPWWATILTGRDPSQAPEGQDVVYLYTPVPVAPTEGWDTARPGAEQRLTDAASRVLSGIDECEIGRFVESPEDLQRRTGAPNGCIYHVDHALTRLGPLRPGRGWAGHRTKVPGLFLSGAGTHPGGGVSGIPGQLAAQAVIRSYSNNKKGGPSGFATA